MRSRRESTISHSAEESVYFRDLVQIETFYGRLVYLAGLRNPDNGRYEFFSAAGASADSQGISLALKKIHETTFRKWMSYPLERKKSEVEFYIASIDQVDRVELIDAWLRLTPYKNLVPASIQGPEREKHTSDFEAILGLLRNVYGVVSPDSGA